MRALLIDPFAKTVTEHHYSGRIFEAVKDGMGTSIVVFRPLTGFNTDEAGRRLNDDLLVMAADAFNKVNALFKIAGTENPFAGKCVIIGTGGMQAGTVDADEFADASTTLEQINGKITWLD